jgi:hypothetical protein
LISFDNSLPCFGRATYSLADEPQLTLHDVNSMKKDAQSNYFYKLRNTKDNGLIPAARPKLLRPISANLVADIMISEERRMQEEAQLLAIKQEKQKLRREQLEAWGNESPSPLTFPSPDGELNFMSPVGRKASISSTKPHESFGFKEREKRGISGQDSTVSGASSIRRGTSKDSKMTSVPCQRKPSRSLSLLTISSHSSSCVFSVLCPLSDP